MTVETLYDTLLAGSQEGQQDRKGRDTCYGCIVRCKRVVDFSQGPYSGEPLYGGPEYETIAGLGSYCGIDDLAAICNANELCNKYGIDTISGGATIAWAMEAFEAGVLTTADTGGLELKFGDAEAMVKLVQMIGEREGFGDILAEGSARAAAELGKGAEFLITAKGQEPPAHMPQVKRSLALMYAVNPFGSDHESSDHDMTYEENTYKAFQDRYDVPGIEASGAGSKPRSRQSGVRPHHPAVLRHAGQRKSVSLCVGHILAALRTRANGRHGQGRYRLGRHPAGVAGSR